MRAGANRPASRHETGTAGSALRLHVHVEEAQAALGKTVNARCRCAARQAAAVAADFPVAQIVGQDEDDVGFVSGLCRRGDGKSRRAQKRDSGLAPGAFGVH